MPGMPAPLDPANVYASNPYVRSVSAVPDGPREELVLFHLSDRYQRADWLEMLQEARQIFPKTGYPTHWNLESNAEPATAAT